MNKDMPDNIWAALSGLTVQADKAKATIGIYTTAKMDGQVAEYLIRKVSREDAREALACFAAWRTDEATDEHLIQYEETIIKLLEQAGK